MDLLQVPAERREVCLIEMLAWLELIELLPATGTAQVRPTFTWIDDGEEGVSGLRLHCLNGTILVGSANDPPDKSQWPQSCPFCEVELKTPAEFDGHYEGLSACAVSGRAAERKAEEWEREWNEGEADHLS